MKSRNGFALIVVLWLLVTLMALASGAVARLRTELRASENRMNQVRAAWATRACEQVLLSRYVDRMRALSMDSLDLGRGVWCKIQPHDAFLRINVNQTDSLGLARVLGSAARAAAVLDWLDEDDVARGEGAEAEWYQSQHRILPRNGPLQDVRELHLIRGFEDADSAWLDALFTTSGSGKIDPTRAGLPVLRSVSALSETAAQRLASLQRGLAGPRGLDDLLESLESLGLSFPPEVFRQLDQRFVVAPDYRTLLIEGGVDGAGVEVRRRMIVTVRLLGNRLAVGEVILE